MQLDPSIFKAYDIRGIVDKTLTERLSVLSAGCSALWQWKQEPPHSAWPATGAFPASGCSML